MIDQPVWYDEDVEDEFVPISWAHGSAWDVDDTAGEDEDGSRRYDFRPHVDDPE